MIYAYIFNFHHLKNKILMSTDFLNNPPPDGNQPTTIASSGIVFSTKKKERNQKCLLVTYL